MDPISSTLVTTVVDIFYLRTIIIIILKLLEIEFCWHVCSRCSIIIISPVHFVLPPLATIIIVTRQVFLVKTPWQLAWIFQTWESGSNHDAKVDCLVCCWDLEQTDFTKAPAFFIIRKMFASLNFCCWAVRH